MQRLPGEGGETFPFYGVVQKKYVPKWGADRFFVEAGLLGADLLPLRVFYHQKMMVAQEHFSEFEVGDTIGFEASSRKDWLRVNHDDELVLVQRAAVQAQEMEISLGYVSAPRRVAGSLFFLSKSDEGWLRIPGEVARGYFIGGVDETLPRYYAMLGLESTAVTQAQIRQAFRELARQFHPDINRAPDATSRFQEINEAYQELSDDGRRALYDRQARTEQLRGSEPDYSYTLWPGHGFGTLKALVEKRGDTLLVNRILSWDRHKRYIDAQVFASKIEYFDHEVGIRVEGWSVVVHESALPFVPRRILEKIKGQLRTASVRVRATVVEVGWWNRTLEKVERRWQPLAESIETEWDAELLERMEHLVVRFEARSRLSLALKRLRGREGVWSRLALDDLAAEFEVDAEELRQAFWRPEYNHQYFGALEANASEIYYSSQFFVFRIGDSLVIEEPCYGAATYVFDDREVEDLVGHFETMNRLELRSSPELQRAFGYRGFAIHTDLDPWFSKVWGLMRRAL